MNEHSMRSSCLVSILLASAAASLSAQSRTWIVDATGGGDHRTIRGAEAAARHGDVLLVRAGTYLTFSTRKGIAVLGASGAVLDATSSGTVVVEGLPASRRFQMAGFRWRVAGQPQLLVKNCAGKVILADLDLQAPTSTVAIAAVRIENSADVVLRQSSVRGAPAVACISSRVEIASCTLRGSDALLPAVVPAHAAVSAFGGSLRLADSALRGGDGIVVGSRALPAQPGLLVFTSTAVDLRGDAQTTIAAGTGVTIAAPAILNRGALDYDSRITLRPHNTRTAIQGTGSALAGRQPYLTGRLPGLGATHALTLDSTPSQPFAVLLGFAGAVTDVPNLVNGLHLDLAQPIVALFAGTQRTSGKTTLSVRVPQQSSLRGAAITWQGLALPSGRLRLSNPLIQTLR